MRALAVPTASTNKEHSVPADDKLLKPSIPTKRKEVVASTRLSPATLAVQRVAKKARLMPASHNPNTVKKKQMGPDTFSPAIRPNENDTDSKKVKPASHIAPPNEIGGTAIPLDHSELRSIVNQGESHERGHQRLSSSEVPVQSSQLTTLPSTSSASSPEADVHATIATTENTDNIEDSVPDCPAPSIGELAVHLTGYILLLTLI